MVRHPVLWLIDFLFLLAFVAGVAGCVVEEPTACQELEPICSDCYDPGCSAVQCRQECNESVDPILNPDRFHSCINACEVDPDRYIKTCQNFCNSLAESNQQDSCQNALDTFMCRKNETCGEGFYCDGTCCTSEETCVLSLDLGHTCVVCSDIEDYTDRVDNNCNGWVDEY